MVGPAFEAWDEMWGDLGAALYIEHGVLTLDSGPESWTRRSIATLDRVGISYDRLDPAETARRFPFLRLDGVESSLYFERGGTLFAGYIVELLAHHIGTSGVAPNTHRTVIGVDPEYGRITLADGDADNADVVVIAAGPWVAACFRRWHTASRRRGRSSPICRRRTSMPRRGRGLPS